MQSTELGTTAVLTLHDVLSAFRVLADNCHIHVDNGTGWLDAAVLSLSGTYQLACGRFLPYLSIDSYGIKFRPGEKDLHLTEATLERIDDNIDRYAAFPDIVNALKVIRIVVENTESIDNVLRINITPEEIASFDNILNLASSNKRGKKNITLQQGKTIPHRGLNAPVGTHATLKT